MSHDSDRQRLVAVRRSLEVALAGSIARGTTVELDQTAVGRISRVDALQAQAMAQAEERRTELRLQAVDHALARLDNDRYGICVKCGEDIAPGRLVAQPEAPFCLPCARE